MIGVIADDLSGAAELGAVGLRYGLRAVILLPAALRSGRMAGNLLNLPSGQPADLLCIDTGSRNCQAGQSSQARRHRGSQPPLRRRPVDL